VGLDGVGNVQADQFRAYFGEGGKGGGELNCCEDGYGSACDALEAVGAVFANATQRGRMLGAKVVENGMVGIRG